MTLQNFSRELYQYFFQRIYGRAALTTRDKKSEKYYDLFITNALERYESIGSDFVWLYITYQFARFEKTGFKPGSYTQQVEVVNVFGQTAFEKFKARRQDLDDLTLKQPYLAKFSITKEDFTNRTQIPFTLTSRKKVLLRQVHNLQSFRSPIKETASRTGVGLEVCAELTDLYNDKDPACQRCHQAKECKLLLQENYPHLYKLKGYE